MSMDRHRSGIGGLRRIFLAISIALCIPAGATTTLPHFGGEDAFNPETLSPSTQFIEHIYQAHGASPIWIDQSGLTEKADQFIDFLTQIETEGLDRDRYHYREIVQLMQKQDPEEVDLWSLELLLDLAYLNLARDLSQGAMDWEINDPRWHIPRAGVHLNRLATILNSDMPIDESLRSLAPVHPQYGKLKDALAIYQRIARLGEWERILPQKSLKLGMRDESVKNLRYRLRVLGDLWGDPALEPDLYDENLSKAVTRFQKRHQLEADGVVGRQTREALEVGISARIEQLKVNLERWRWMPRELGERHILVNIPRFELDYVERDEIKLSMRVIVGDTRNRTPVFTEELTYIDINPVWNVPDKITRDEILPMLVMKPDYLEEKGFRILSDWSNNPREVTLEETGWSEDQQGDFPYRLQQAAGEKNALGKIKFLLPNRFSVYLHDTPGKKLFEKSSRTFSHGCIRLENPEGLAVTLFSQLEQWDEERLKRVLTDGNNAKAILKRPVPVYIVYFTSWVDEDGLLHFSKDFYRRDSALVRHLFPIP
jgi:murein L,D-transpeptidase YcbB/YkuD